MPSPPAQSRFSLGFGLDLCQRARPLRSTAVALTAMMVLSGCASNEQSQSSSAPLELTGDPETDRIAQMMRRQAEALENDSFDLSSIMAEQNARNEAAAQSEPAAKIAEAKSGTADTANDPPVKVASPDSQSNENFNPDSTFARPFADGSGLTDDPDPFESQLASYNAPPGLLDQSHSDESKADNAVAEDPPALRLAEEIQRQPGEPFAKALAWASLSPLIGIAPESGDSLPGEATEIVDAVGDLLNDLSRLGSDPDPNEAAAMARSFAESLNKDLSLKITAAALCTRVDGFGQYKQLPLSTPKFLSGRTNPVVLYIEIDHFDYAPVASSYRGPDADDVQQWEVRLSQEINLYAANQDVPIWSLPASTLTDFSRNKRRDFHVINPITLPATLALGQYKLKIKMRDLVSGEIDETMIPIQIVNDASLLSFD